MTLAIFLNSFGFASFAQTANNSRDFELPEGFFTEISGKYIGKQAGLEILFPDVWSGLGIRDMLIVVSRDVATDIDATAAVAEAAMIVMALPREDFSNAFSSINALSEEIKENLR